MLPTTLALFEDDLAPDLAPVADTRPVWDLLLGASTLRQRSEGELGLGATGFHVRRHLRGLVSQGEIAPDRSLLLLNGAAVATPGLRCAIEGIGSDEWVMMEGERIVAAAVAQATLAESGWIDGEAPTLDALRALPAHEAPGGTLVRYLWDLLDRNAAAIELDARGIAGVHEGTISTGAHLVAPERIAIDRGATVAPGVVLDASGGPIILDADVTIMAGAILQGPCAIGRGSTIKIGAKIYAGTAIGPRCKVGGEVENSTLLGYANKQHDGFMGHSYLGAWTNFGADTNTSDLKNNYGRIRADLNGRTIETGRMFLGTLAGDHVRTGINTMLNTGTVAGVFANIFGGGFPPKAVPAFSWGGHGDERYQIERALDVARTVMARRDVALDSETELLYRLLHTRSTGADHS